MEPKNSLNKINKKHLFFGNLKEDRLLNCSDVKDDFTEIVENTYKYLDEIKNKNYKYTLDELCNRLEITKSYANTYFLDKLDTIYITRSCKLFIYALRSKDTKQIKEFSKLFASPDNIKVCSLLCFKDNENFREKLDNLNLTKERLLKKYFISEDSFKRAIKEVFKNEIRTRDSDGELIKTEYIDIDDAIANEIVKLGLISTNTLKDKFNISTDTQFHRILGAFQELEDLRIAVVNKNNNKYNTVRYINNKDVIEKINRALISEKEANKEFANERYKREKFL